MKCFKVLAILLLFFCCNSSAHAGVFSKIGNWFNTGWNDYGYQQHNSYYNHPPRHRFYNNGNFTGITPPINTQYHDNDYYCPNNVNRFNHLPNGTIPQMNVPTRVITDFSSNVGTGTKIQILD